MITKSIKQIIAAQKVNMGGHLLDQPLPMGDVNYVDPFLLIHHWKSELPGGQRAQDVGVGPHPHRGFSPVTFIYKGSIEHRDSLGNFAKVDEGGTQWMFAGRGITHSERFGKEMAEQGGELEFIQFWVNAPAANKMDLPFYQPISKEETPLVENEGSKVWVVSGDYKGVKGAAPTNSPQLLIRGEIKKDNDLELEVPASFNAIIYLLDGALSINEKKVLGKDMIVFENDGERILLKATENTRFMLLSGEPLNEAVESYGPFVMTNQTEVMTAIRDAQMGKMGVLIEEFA